MSHNPYSYDSSHYSQSAHSGNTTSRTSENENTRTNTSSSSQPLMQQSVDEPVMPSIQHSATFYPTSYDEFYTPYADWNDELVSSPVSYTATSTFPAAGQQPDTNIIEYNDFVANTPSRSNVLERAASVPYGGADLNDDSSRGYVVSPPVAGSSMSNSPIISPPVDPVMNSSFQSRDIYSSPTSDYNNTVSPSLSSFSHSPNQMRPSMSLSRGSSGPTRKKTVKGFMPSVQEDSISNDAGDGLYGNSGIGSKVSEVRTSHVDPLQFIEEGNGGGRWVKRTQSQMKRSNTVLGRAANILRSATRRGGNYHGVSSEERRMMSKEDRALTLKQEEERAKLEGYCMEPTPGKGCVC